MDWFNSGQMMAPGAGDWLSGMLQPQAGPLNAGYNPALNPEQLVMPLAQAGVAPPWPSGQGIQGVASPNQGSALDVSNPLGGGTGLGGLGKALQGVKAPAAPELQKLSTPSVPRPQDIGASGIAAIMSKLMAERGNLGPSLRLGQAIGR